MKFIPSEIVDLIADYHDYDKYCKPKHEELFKSVLDDIKKIDYLLSPIYPSIYPSVIVGIGWGWLGPGYNDVINDDDDEFYDTDDWEDIIPDESF